MKGEVRLYDLLATYDLVRCPNLILMINLRIPKVSVSKVEK